MDDSGHSYAHGPKGGLKVFLKGTNKEHEAGGQSHPGNPIFEAFGSSTHCQDVSLVIFHLGEPIIDPPKL
jgi:hypothetical protein